MVAGSAAALAEVQDPVADRGLQAGEGEVAVLAALQRARQVEARGVAVACQPLHRRAARIAQAQHLRDLVERLAQRIVDAWCRAGGSGRRPRPRRAGNGRPRPGAGGRGSPDPSTRRAVSACASRWLTATSGSPWTRAIVLPVSRPTIRPPIRPGPAVAATPARSREADARLAHRLGHEQVELLDMGAGCYLRHHAAIGGVLGELGEQRGRPARGGRRGPGPPPSRRSWSRSPARCRPSRTPVSRLEAPMPSRSPGNQP